MTSPSRIRRVLRFWPTALVIGVQMYALVWLQYEKRSVRIYGGGMSIGSTYTTGWPLTYVTWHEDVSFSSAEENREVTSAWRGAPLWVDVVFAAAAVICSGFVAERLRCRDTKSRMSIGGIMVGIFAVAIFFALTRESTPLREWQWSADFMRAFPYEWPDCIKPAYAVAYFGLICIVLCACWLLTTLFVALASSAMRRLRPPAPPSDQ